MGPVSPFGSHTGSLAQPFISECRDTLSQTVTTALIPTLGPLSSQSFTLVVEPRDPLLTARATWSTLTVLPWLATAPSTTPAVEASIVSTQPALTTTVFSASPWVSWGPEH